MANRLKLDDELRELISNNNVYYQPPASVEIKYPCIIYERSTGDSKYADNYTYRFSRQYTITSISKDPDTSMVDKIVNHFPMIRYNRHFVSDNLYHDVFVLYY